MSMTDAAIVGAAGVRPRFFRPPYSGGPESITRTYAAELASTLDPGHLIALSNYDSEDWRRARCLPDRAQRDAARAPGRRDPLPRRRRRSLADRRRAATPGAAPGAAGLSLRLAVRAGRGAARRDPAACLGVGAPSGRAPDRRPRRRALDHGRHARAADPDRRPGGSPGAGGRRLRPAPRPPVAAPGLAAVHAAGLGDRPAYNEAAGIERAVRSLAGGDYPAHEVVVVDDGSDDGTAEIVEGLGLAGVRVIRQPNAGKAAALSAGLAAASAEVIVTVDADTVFEEQTLRRLVEPFADPEVGAVAGNTKVGNRRGLLGQLAAHRLRDRVQPRPAPVRHAPLHADGSGRRRGVPAPGDRRCAAASRARPWRRTRT